MISDEGNEGGGGGGEMRLDLRGEMKGMRLDLKGGGGADEGNETNEKMFPVRMIISQHKHGIHSNWSTVIGPQLITVYAQQ